MNKQFQLITVMELIDLPKEILQKVLVEDQKLDYGRLNPMLEKLLVPDTWDQGELELKNQFDSEFQGIQMLTIMLHMAYLAHEKYMKMKIPIQVYIDTMKCFTRFIGEHKESFGQEGFDRSFWTSRQISLHLFRIGELEYEFVDEKKESYVSIHIPSDTKLTPLKLKESFIAAKLFIVKYFPKYKDCSFYCETWMLYPKLKEVLAKDSNILSFQKLFQILSQNHEVDDYLEWIFKIPENQKKIILMEELPEKTSLQRNLKVYLLTGGTIGIAKGRLHEDSFTMECE